MVTSSVSWLLALIIFQHSLLKQFLIIKKTGYNINV